MSQPDGRGAAPEDQAAGAAGRIVLLLEALAVSESSVGVRELGRLTGIDKSAVSRLLTQLQRLGVVEQADGAQGRYTVGPRLFTISSMVAARDSLVAAARPILRALVDEVNETCYLSTMEPGGYVFRDKVDCDKPIRYFLEMGRAFAINAGAGGRAVLSGVGLERAAHLIGSARLERITPRTVTDPDELLRLAQQDRDRGYSVSIGERVPGGSAIAAPYYLADGTCRGALVLAIPAERLEEKRIPALGEAVSAAARELSVRLGHSPTWRLNDTVLRSTV